MNISKIGTQVVLYSVNTREFRKVAGKNLKERKEATMINTKTTIEPKENSFRSKKITEEISASKTTNSEEKEQNISNTMR